MPLYTYTTQDGQDSIREMFSMKYQPPSIKRNGKRYHRDIAGDHRDFRATPGNWPKKSVAMGVAPDQAAEAAKQAAELGVPTDFCSATGDAIVTSQKHRARLARALGYVDRS